ncbi:MAG: chemotaxis protein CheW [Desulfobulbus sp.]
MMHGKVADTQGKTLAELLGAIDEEVAPVLQWDLEQTRANAHRSIRKRTPFISFFLGNDELALDIGSILELGELPPVTRLPNLPTWIRGITQIRGEVLSVVDFVTLFDIPHRNQSRVKKPYLLFAYHDFKCCLIVDKITGVVHIDRQLDHFEKHNMQQGSSLAPLSDLLLGAFQTEHRTINVLDSEKIGQTPLLRKWR